MIYNSIFNKKKKLAVIGLGYVGLPVALAFAKKASVIGFDINNDRLALMRNHTDPSNEMQSSDFEGCDITFTSSTEVLKEAGFYIVAVPTPLDAHNVPDLTAVFLACETVGKVIKKGDYVVFESTVYPGCTEEDCIPIIEKHSKLKYGQDFKAGYSPERINPGDKEHTLSNVTKVVAGCDEEALEEIAAMYGLIVNAGIHKASSIKVAEAAKVIENSQRDVNIAFMNELSIIFDRMGINTYEVLEAAATKWNFLNFKPGLVGGHCIGVDPYYLTYKAAELGFNSRVILSGRYINDNMGNYLSKKILQHIIAHVDSVKQSKVLMLGITFKENVSDVRNSKVTEVVHTLRSYQINMFVHDPYADGAALAQHGIKLITDLDDDYDAVIIAVPHAPYLKFDDFYFKSITKDSALIADLKGIYRDKIQSRKYWSF